jgi:hypothetical protein
VQQARGRRPDTTSATCDDGDESLEVGHVRVLSAEQRIDVDLGTGAGRLRTFSGDGIDLFEADRGGDERPRIDSTARVRRDGGVETRSLTKRLPQ